MERGPVKPPRPRSSRRYVTPKRDKRAAATRAAILAAAEALFLRDGYARTSIKAIAAVAGVSEKTMYLAFATKATLLRQVIQHAVQGDEAPTPLSERPEWRALVAGPADQVFARFAALNAALMTRTAEIIALGESAASTDPELARVPRPRPRGYAGQPPRAGRRTPTPGCPRPGRQRGTRRRHDVRPRRRRRRLPAPDPRMRLDRGALRRAHRSLTRGDPREDRTAVTNGGSSRQAAANAHRVCTSANRSSAA